MSSIVLIESKKYFNAISSGLPSDYNAVLVDSKSISEYNNCSDVIAVVCSRGLAHKLETINLPNCKLIQLESVGFDDVNLSCFAKKHITVCNAKFIYDNCLAEYVVFAMLLYAKRFHKSPKRWWFRPLRNYHYMTEIAGKIVGIMGVGQIGGAVAKRLSTFGVKIIGYANHTKEKDFFDKIYHKADFPDFLSACDFLVNVLPHDSSTFGLLNKESLGYLKPNVVFINIGRDSIYEKCDFVRFMRMNKDAVAILDIFEIIPRYITNPLRRFSNVLIFPRVSAISQESDNYLIRLVIDNITRLQNHQEFKNQIV